MEILKRNQAGITLLELTIVLVIVGLLLGGVLTGKVLIDLAKIKNFETDFKNLQLFIYGYQDKYGAIPGDDLNVVAHVGGILATTPTGCLLYTSDAADDLTRVDLGGRRIIKK